MGPRRLWRPQAGDGPTASALISPQQGWVLSYKGVPEGEMIGTEASWGEGVQRTAMTDPQHGVGYGGFKNRRLSAGEEQTWGRTCGRRLSLICLQIPNGPRARTSTAE